MSEEVLKDAMPKKFRTAVGGYNKNDVNEYIMYMNSNFKSIEETLKNTINLQKQEIDAKEAERIAAVSRAEDAASCRASLAEMEAALAERDAELMAVNSAKSALAAENERLQQKLVTEKENYLKLEAENRQKTAELEQNGRESAERISTLEKNWLRQRLKRLYWKRSRRLLSRKFCRQTTRN